MTNKAPTYTPYLQMAANPMVALKAVGPGANEVGTDILTFSKDLHDFITQEWSKHQILLTAASWMLVYYLIFVGLWAENIVPGMQQKCWAVNNNCSTLVGTNRVCDPEVDDVHAIIVSASGSSAPYYPLFFHLPILLYFAGAFVFCIYHTIVRDVIPVTKSVSNTTSTRTILTDIFKFHTIILWLVAFILFIVKQMGMGGLDAMPWWAITLLPAFSHFATAVTESVMIYTGFDKIALPSDVAQKQASNPSPWNTNQSSKIG